MHKRCLIDVHIDSRGLAGKLGVHGTHPSQLTRKGIDRQGMRQRLPEKHMIFLLVPMFAVGTGVCVLFSCIRV